VTGASGAWFSGGMHIRLCVFCTSARLCEKFHYLRQFSAQRRKAKPKAQKIPGLGHRLFFKALSQRCFLCH